MPNIMTQSDRERLIGEKCSNYGFLPKEKIWDEFIKTQEYLSIPPATDPLRERIEARIVELKEIVDTTINPWYTKSKFDELENLLKTT